MTVDRRNGCTIPAVFEARKEVPVLMSHQENRSSRFGVTLRKTTVLAFMIPVLIVVSTESAQTQTYKVLYNFTGSQDGAYPKAGLTMDRGGNLYGTAYQGGSSNRGTVFNLTRTGSGWIFSTLYSFTGRLDGGAPIARVVFGPDGSLYGTTEFGGFNCGVGCGTVFNLKVTPCTNTLCPWAETVLYRFSGSSDGANPGYGDLTFDGAAHIFGTTFFGGNNAQGVVYKLTAQHGNWTESALYRFTGANDGGNPYSSVIFDKAGKLYGSAYAGGTHGYGTVFQLKPSGSSWTENTVYAFQSASDGGSPFGGVVFDNAGNLYGATSGGGPGSGGTVYELMPADGSWTFGVVYSFNGSAYLPGPYGSLTMDAAGNLYGTTTKDGAYGAGSVFKLMPSDGGWTETDLYDFASGSEGAVPYGSVLIDASGNLYGTASQGGANGYGVIWEITP
jgi:uncharacterized repeat protein (TIGR03803 family)